MLNVVDYIFTQTIDDVLDQKEFKHGIDLTHEEKLQFILEKYQKKQSKSKQRQKQAKTKSRMLNISFESEIEIDKTDKAT